jgi:hypothetical protein
LNIYVKLAILLNKITSFFKFRQEGRRNFLVWAHFLRQAAKNRAFRGCAIAPAPARMHGRQTVLRKKRLQNRSAIFQVCLYGPQTKDDQPCGCGALRAPCNPLRTRGQAENLQTQILDQSR